MIELMMSIARLPSEAEAAPAGYRLRGFRPEDRQSWLELQSSTGVYDPVAPDLFEREFGDRASDHAERIVFAEVAGEAVGVSAAWYPAPDVASSAGRVHWVAVRPSHQRRGLGRALVVETLRRLHGLGYTSAYLTTGSENHRAIRLYRSLGFEPVPRTPEEEWAWRVLRAPVLESRRLRLEPLSPSHSPGMFELWHHPEVCEHAGAALDSQGRPIDLPAASTADSDRLLEYWLDRARAGTGLRWAVMLRDGSGFSGAVGFNGLGSRPEYAYHFVPRFWGAGLATEASHLALAWAFSSGAESVEAFIEPDNVRSVRLVERLGFEPWEPAATGPARYALDEAKHRLGVRP